MKFIEQRRWRKNFLYHECFNFPFLINKSTVSYLNKNKTIFVFPCSGRSSLAQSIRLIYGKATKLFSKNDYYMHESFEVALIEQTKHIVIDHEQLDTAWIQFYKEKALQYKYFVLFIEPKVPSNIDLSSSQIQQENSPEMRNGLLSSPAAEYFGFFLNEADSRSILQKAKVYFDKCFEYFPAFRKIYIARTGSSSFDQIYNIDYNNLLHCTTFHRNDTTHPSYINQALVKESIGKHFTIHIQGYFFTTRTAGVAIRLKKHSLDLFNKTDDFSYKRDPDGNIFATFPLKTRKTLKITEVNESDNVLTANREVESDVDFVPLPPPQSSQNNDVISLRKGSRAHLTLGTQDGVSAVQTGFDLMALRHQRTKRSGRKGQAVSTTNGGCGGLADGLKDLTILDKKVAGENEEWVEELVIEDGGLLVCRGGECEVRLDWRVPVNCIFNAAF